MNPLELIIWAILINKTCLIVLRKDYKLWPLHPFNFGSIYRFYFNPKRI